MERRQRIKKLIRTRTIFRAISFLMLALAYFGFNWGTKFEPVQKSSAAVSFVFDISNSMLAKDAPEQKSRLEAAALYAQKLLSKMEGTSVSIVLAKGDGIEAIPLTEDYMMIESLLNVLSPKLMTAPGSSLGKGIMRAREGLSKNYSAAGRIWLFTDGEETDNGLRNALTECIKSGISVSIIGFGGEEEVEVLAGDGKTYVRSALRSEKIKDAITQAQKNMGYYKNQTPLFYVDSVDKLSAARLLSQLELGNSTLISYEAKSVSHYKLFLLLAVLFFAFSYIFTEFDFSKLRFDSMGGRTAIIGVIFTCTLLGTGLFTGCSNTDKILFGAYSFNQKNYRHAVSCFVQSREAAIENDSRLELDYALYDLGTAYSALEEDGAALEKLSQVSEEAPQAVQYAAYYNAGIIAYKNEDYQKARDYFRKALEIDSKKINAKINLELSITQSQVQVREAQSNAVPAVTENTSNPELEKAVFERIKENNQKQWKNSETDQPSSLADDY